MPDIEKMSNMAFSQIQEVMKMIQFGKNDEENLSNLMKHMKKKELITVVERFYETMLQFDYPKSFFSNPQLLERVKQKQVKYFEDFLTDSHNNEFFSKRMQLGSIHERIGLDNNWYLASYALFYSEFVKEMASMNGGKIDIDTLQSFGKLMLLDIGAVVTSYITAREEVINAQATEVIELSSPVLKLTDDIIVIPLLGTLDSARAFQIMEKILNSIQESNAKAVILDITGVPLIDTATGANLVRTVRAIRLMGSECILTGLSPLLAQTIVELGIDLTTILTKNTLADGFVEALKAVSKD